MRGSDIAANAITIREVVILQRMQYHYTRGNDIAANATNSQYQ